MAPKMTLVVKPLPLDKGSRERNVKDDTFNLTFPLRRFASLDKSLYIFHKLLLTIKFPKYQMERTPFFLASPCTKKFGRSDS